MSGVAVVRHLLANYPALIAIVPAGRIMAGVLPLNTDLPGIGVTKVDGVRRNTLRMSEPKVLVTDRVQVTATVESSAEGGTDYAGLDAILRLVPRACPNTRGTINGVVVENILPDIEGPDLEDPDNRRLSRSHDIMVTWVADR